MPKDVRNMSDEEVANEIVRLRDDVEVKSVTQWSRLDYLSQVLAVRKGVEWKSKPGGSQWAVIAPLLVSGGYIPAAKEVEE